jgi:hypothetical protein
VLERKGGPVLDHDVLESRDSRLPFRREGLEPHVFDEPSQHVAHERREPDPGEPVVERLGGDLDAMLVVERAE